MALGPVAHRVEVDVDHGADLFALVAIGHDLLDVREELELVLDVLGREHRAVVGASLEPAHVLDAVDDLQVAVRVDEAGVAGVVPAVRRQHLGRGLRVLVIALEQAGRLDQDLAVVGDADFHALARHADGVGAGLMVRLQAHEHRRFRGAVELLQVHADRAVKAEQVRAYGLAGGVGHAHPAHAQVVAQRAVDQQIAQSVQQALSQAQRLAIEARRAYAPRQVHEVMEHGALQAPGVFHAYRHAGQQAFKDARRRKVVGRADFLQVDADGRAGLRAVDHIAAGQPLGVAEDVLADPGRWQVGQHVLVTGQRVKLGANLGPVDQRGMGVDHALGVAGGAGGEEHRGHVTGLRFRHFGAEKVRVLAGVNRSSGNQLVQRGQARLVVLAQAARVVVKDMGQLRALGAQFEHLVDLLLVLDHGEAHLGVVDRKHAFGGHRVLVQRHRNRAQ